MKVIDKLGKSDAVTLVFAKLPDGKIKVTSQLRQCSAPNANSARTHYPYCADLSGNKLR